MAQQYKFSTADGKHASFYNRPTPVFQLMGQTAPFNSNLARRNQEGCDPIIPDVEERQQTSPRSDRNDENQRGRSRYANSRVADSQMSSIFSHDCEVETQIDQAEMDQAAIDRAERALLVVGGQTAGKDFYRTTAQACKSDDFNQKKVMTKRMQPQDNVISPIDGSSLSYTKTSPTSAISAENIEENDANSTADPLIAKVRNTLSKRGATGVLGMGRLFRIMDDDDSKSLSMSEFKKAMRDSSLVLQDKELTYLFKLFDTDSNGSISFNEFMYILRAPLTSRRRALVKLAFEIIDKDGNGKLDIRDICDVYDTSKHPEVISKKKTKDQVLKEFLDAFVIGGMKADGAVSREQFEDYYANIGASIDSEDYFELMIRNAWHISGGEGQAANSANRRVLVTRADGSEYVEEIKNDLGLKQGDRAGAMARLSAQGVTASPIGNSGYAGDIRESKAGYPRAPPKGPRDAMTQSRGNSPVKDSKMALVSQSRAVKEEEYAFDLLLALRDQLAARGAKGIVGLQRQFRIIDDNGSKSLDMSEFKKALTDTRIQFKKSTDAEVLFRFFDRDGMGSIDYDEFLTTIRGKLNSKRKMLVNLAFDVLDKDGSNQIDPLDLVGVYDTSKHPDVISRKKTTQEVLRDFLDGFDVGGEVDGMVTRQEFENYYANVSSSIDDDQYFELMIRNAWHISGGEGQAANSANRRVLVTRADGSEYVEEIKNDLGLKQEDRAGAMARLSAQGVVASSVSLYGSAGNIQSPRMTRPDSASIVSRLRNQAVANRMDRTPAAPLPPTPAPSVTLLDVARSGPQGDYGLPPTRPVTANFTANKKMFTDTNSATAKDALLGSPSKVFTNPRQLPPAGLGLLIDRLKSALKARGAGGFAALEKMFESMDEDGNGTLSVAELKSVMKKLNLPVLESDVRQIFEYFDKDQSGSIDSSEFMEGIRDPLTAKRLALVDMAFTELDYDGTGEVLFETIASMYNVEMHPEVVAGRLSPKSALANFLETFDGGIEIEGVVTRTEFRNYYCNVGASIDSDDYFDLLLRGVWNLHEGDSALYDNSNFRNSVSPRSVIHGQVGATASSPSARSGLVSASAVRVAPKGLSALTVTSSLSLSPQKARASTAGTAFPPPNDTMSKAAPYYSYTYGTEKPLSASAAAAAKVLGTRLNPASRIPDNGLLHLIARMKADIISRGPIGFTSLQRVFQTADINGDGTLTLAEFKCALQSMRLNISQSEVRLLFQYFDADDSGTLCFTEFVGGLRNDLNPARLTVVKEAFRKLDTKRCGSVEIADITKAFNPSHHPDVLAGQQTTRQAMATFLDTFDAGGDIPGRVTESEFINYYTNIGALIDVDEEFDLVLRGVWGLGWEVKTAPVVVTYETKTCSNAPASSLREALLQGRGQPTSSSYSSNEDYGPENQNRFQNPASRQYGIANEIQLRADVTIMQAVAVQKFTQRNYKKACDIFLEALAILQKILPPNHDECVQLMYSVEACKRRMKDSGQM